MSALSGVALGIGGLALLDLVIGSAAGTSAFGWVATAPAAWLASFEDPTKPLIPDLRTSSSSSGGSGSTLPSWQSIAPYLASNVASAPAPPVSSLPAPSTYQAL